MISTPGNYVPEGLREVLCSLFILVIIKLMLWNRRKRQKLIYLKTQSPDAQLLLINLYSSKSSTINVYYGIWMTFVSTASGSTYLHS